MGKFTNYILLLSGFFIIFYIFGLNDGATGSLIGLLLNIGSLKSYINSGQGWGAIGLIIGGLTTYGVVAIITRQFFSESLALATLLPFLLGFAYDFVVIYKSVAQISSIIALLVLSPMIVVYVFTVIEWWRGVTT
jgi:hypothetical protein